MEILSGRFICVLSVVWNAALTLLCRNLKKRKERNVARDKRLKEQAKQRKKSAQKGLRVRSQR